jgi:hypothetical protein
MGWGMGCLLMRTDSLDSSILYGTDGKSIEGMASLTLHMWRQEGGGGRWRCMHCAY